MNASTVQQTIPARSTWRMPIRPERYDRSSLSEAERRALAVLVNGHAPVNSAARRKAEATLGRLIRPLHEIYALRRVDASPRPHATRVMLGQMHRRGKAFWHWSACERRFINGTRVEIKLVQARSQRRDATVA